VKQKFIEAYMKTAETFAGLSSAVRLHVGAIVVKDDRIISIGYNGMPSGWENTCEDKIYCDDGDWSEQQLPKTQNLPWRKYKLVSKPEVLHAETNAIAKLAKSTESGLGATMFITHAPCLDCAKLIYQSGISGVLYRNSYRNTDGITFLEKSGVQITQV
jgi:dCMP deaminase